MAKKTTKRRQNGKSARTEVKNPRPSIAGYRINFDAINDSKIPRPLRDQLRTILPLIQHDPRQAIARLENLKELFPNIPLIFNHLIAAHGRLGNNDKSRELIVENYQKNPDYLFAKINYAQMCLQALQPEKIPEIYDHKYDLKLLYPGRDEFHVTEFMGFTATLCAYFGIIGQKDRARLYYDALLQVDPNSEVTIYAKRFVKPSLLDKLRFWLAARVSENEKKLKQAGNADDTKPRRGRDSHFTA